MTLDGLIPRRIPRIWMIAALTALVGAFAAGCASSSQIKPFPQKGGVKKTNCVTKPKGGTILGLKNFSVYISPEEKKKIIMYNKEIYKFFSPAVKGCLTDYSIGFEIVRKGYSSKNSGQYLGQYNHVQNAFFASVKNKIIGSPYGVLCGIHETVHHLDITCKKIDRSAFKKAYDSMNPKKYVIKSAIEDILRRSYDPKKSDYPAERIAYLVHFYIGGFDIPEGMLKVIKPILNMKKVDEARAKYKRLLNIQYEIKGLNGI